MVQQTRSWHPSLAIKVSAVLHAGVLCGLLVAPELLWPGIALLAANHATLTLLGFIPRSDWLGPNISQLSTEAKRKNQIALTFDDGPDPEVTPKILKILDQHDFKATFFCIADKAEKYPDIVRMIIRNGHLVENHSYHHRKTFSLMGPGAMKREISAAQTILSQLTGRKPRFFRPIAGIRNPFLDPVLHRLGLSLVSWSQRCFDTCSAQPDRLYKRLTNNLSAGDILLLHDGNAARTIDGVAASVLALPKVLEAIKAAGLVPVTLNEGLDEVGS